MKKIVMHISVFVGLQFFSKAVKPQACNTTIIPINRAKIALKNNKILIAAQHLLIGSPHLHTVY